MKRILLPAGLALLTASALAQSNPSPQATEAARNQPCTDPWINLAYRALTMRPNGEFSACECNPKLYNNGSWRDYAELLGYVRQYRQQSGIRLNYWKMQDGSYVVQALHNNAPLGVSRFDANGNLLAAGGARVAAGGLGTVGSGSQNAVGNNGSWVTGIPGRELQNVFPALPGFTYGGGQGLRTSGSGSLTVQP